MCFAVGSFTFLFLFFFNNLQINAPLFSELPAWMQPKALLDRVVQPVSSWLGDCVSPAHGLDSSNAWAGAATNASFSSRVQLLTGRWLQGVGEGVYYAVIASYNRLNPLAMRLFELLAGASSDSRSEAQQLVYATTNGSTRDIHNHRERNRSSDSCGQSDMSMRDSLQPNPIFESNVSAVEEGTRPETQTIESGGEVRYDRRVSGEREDTAGGELLDREASGGLSEEALVHLALGEEDSREEVV
jgi:hypothetical protein